MMSVNPLGYLNNYIYTSNIKHNIYKHNRKNKTYVSKKKNKKKNC